MRLQKMRDIHSAVLMADIEMLHAERDSAGADEYLLFLVDADNERCCADYVCAGDGSYI